MKQETVKKSSGGTRNSDGRPRTKGRGRIAPPSSVLHRLFIDRRHQPQVEQGLALSLLGLGIVLRLIPHPPNFAPISAIALFGGVYLARPYAVVLPLLAMFASDMIGQALGLFPGFHRTMPAVYGSFALVGLIGLWVRSGKSAATIIVGSLAASVLFFFITNFAVWYGGTMYPQTSVGLVAAYVAGLPFFRNTLLGDLFYTGVLFGAYEAIRSSLTAYRLRATAVNHRL